MKKHSVVIAFLVTLLTFAPLGLAQGGSANISRALGVYEAQQYNWAPGQVRLLTGNTATGSQTVTLYSGTVTLADGRVIVPFSINAPLTVDIGSNAETVTPTAVTGCTFGGSIGSCSITASFSNTHGAGTVVFSGTYGLQEAVNDAFANGGGVVVISNSWAGQSTKAATIATVSPYYNVTLQDTSGVPQYWSAQPTTLTALATPATRSAAAGATQVISATSAGTFTNAPQYVAVTYVDMLGGESPASASYNFTPADATHGIFFAAPAASTGAVGWRAYVGVTGTNTMYQIPITASTCTLSTLVGTVTACAIGSSATFAGPVTTTALAPGYVVNVYRPNTQSHTTFAYVPTNDLPAGSWQAHYGPFTATANVPAGNIAVLATVPLPSGLLNQIGKAIRVSGKATLTAVNTATPTFAVSLGPTFSTGTPTAICTMANTTAMGAVAFSAAFSCTITTNATGATGTVMPDGFAINQVQAGTTTAAMAVDTGTAAITNALNTQNNVYVIYTSSTAATNPIQLLDLHVETLN